MRLLLLSDIHANLHALEAVLEDAGRHAYDQVVHLGDAVGYGPRPHEVLDHLRALDATCILGNHDELMLQILNGTRAADGIVTQALAWQATQLQPSDAALIGSWRDGIEDAEVGARYRHGTPTSLHEYTDSLGAAREAFAAWHGRVAFVGHTHLPGVYATLNAPVGEWVKHQSLSDGGSYMVPPSARVILNPGSVGQPRDGNPHASYATFDSARGLFQVFRVPYDIEATQAEIRAAGLPDVLAARLSLGK
ncbi:metallophosphoesterase family protein [Deinococcus maricopensis]|uniref:Metallophosphoesterase n=1 Tax=Deinococcus maricopensis (strain DSM 21211 / LMG 22137 / NRRL B-23946 / LB-34) TaxID=709986 RepID=E8U3Y7_DEIML|nr:metallophosphoesterase family protein [Deinococcus maricopensis]ADV65681.1 metallophosphoesterase [Deinococcus maricopensis DSM 21211]